MGNKNNRDFILCDMCKSKIYREDSTHYGDDYYELNDMTICEECISDYLKEHKRVFS